MSRTEIYRLGPKPEGVADISNAWRGAMYVWSDFAKRYWGLDYFPFGPEDLQPEDLQYKIWNTPKHKSVPEHEKLVLLSTMDNATIGPEGLPKLIEAFDKYAEEHPNSSFKEQADVLRSIALAPGEVIAWNQTSVSEFWGRGWDKEKDEPLWYDLATGNKHFDIVKEGYGPGNNEKPPELCRNPCPTRNEYEFGRCTLPVGHAGGCHETGA